MAYYDNPGTINDEALSIVDGRTYQVIQIADSQGNILDPAQGSVVFDGEVVVSSEVEIKNDSGNPIPIVEGFSIPEHDSVGVGYTGNNLTTLTYTNGGSNVATLTLAYDVNNRITSITKS